MIEKLKTLKDYTVVKARRVGRSMKRHPFRWIAGTVVAVGAPILGVVLKDKLFPGNNDQPVALPDTDYEVSDADSEALDEYESECDCQECDNVDEPVESDTTGD